MPSIVDVPPNIDTVDKEKVFVASKPVTLKAITD